MTHIVAVRLQMVNVSWLPKCFGHLGCHLQDDFFDKRIQL